MCFMKANNSSNIPSYLLAQNYCLCFLGQGVWRVEVRREGEEAACGPLNFLFSDIALAANSRVLICMVTAWLPCFPQGVLWSFYNGTLSNFPLNLLSREKYQMLAFFLCTFLSSLFLPIPYLFFQLPPSSFLSFPAAPFNLFIYYLKQNKTWQWERKDLVC